MGAWRRNPFQSFVDNDCTARCYITARMAATSNLSKPPRSYADAPRLPGDEALDPRALVGAGSAPVELEIGPGRGWFLVERLESDPTARIVGLEIRRKWASIVDARLEKRGLSGRGRVFAEDARQVLPRLVPGTLSVVYVHFPDPWWKKRHAKRRVVNPGLLSDVAEALAPGGELFVQTDVFDRAEQFEAMVANESRLAPWSTTARVEDNPYQARSPRERRAMADGLPVLRLRYRRIE